MINNFLKKYSEFDIDISDSVLYNKLITKIDDQCFYYDSNSNIFDDNNNNTNSIIHFNARSLSKNINNITNYLDCIKLKFDIIVITETWLNEFNSNIHFIKGYNALHTTRLHKRGGGTSIYINNNFKFKSIDILCKTIPNKFDIVGAEIELDNLNKIIVSGIYKYPEYDITDFSDDLFDIINPFMNNSNVYLCGDFNINLMKDKCPKVNNFIDVLHSLDLHPLITKPSRICDSISSLIDNIYTNNNTIPCSNGLLYTDLSDHLPIFSIFKLMVYTKNKKNKKLSKYIKIISEQNLIDFNVFLKNYDWSSILDNSNINDSFEEFINIILFNKDNFSSTKKINLNSEYKPWLSHGLKKCIIKKNNFLKFIKKIIQFPIIQITKNIKIV